MSKDGRTLVIVEIRVEIDIIITRGTCKREMSGNQRPLGVVVSTSDHESACPSSNPG